MADTEVRLATDDQVCRGENQGSDQDLGDLEQYYALRLRSWAHQLGWRGNTATKSRAYSTTYVALNAARIEHRRSQDADAPDVEGRTVTAGFWVLDQVDHDSPGEAMFAAGIAEDERLNREITCEALADTRWQEGGCFSVR